MRHQHSVPGLTIMDKACQHAARCRGMKVWAGDTISHLWLLCCYVSRSPHAMRQPVMSVGNKAASYTCFPLANPNIIQKVVAVHGGHVLHIISHHLMPYQSTSILPENNLCIVVGKHVVSKV